MKLVAQDKVELEQRSREWYEFRNKRIGASDASIICGLSSWKTAHELWLEKIGRVTPPDNSMNFAIQRGIRLEPVVLAMTNIILDRDFSPATFVSNKIDYLMASFDGFDENFNEACEIKVGNKKDHDALREDDPKSVPEKYYPQLQQQMFVKNLPFTYYVSYYLPKGAGDMSGNLKIMKVLRDEIFLDRYLPAAAEFYECLNSDAPPNPWKINI